MSSDGANRRVDFRAPIELRVDYKKMNTFFADYTKNISRGGTFIRTARPLPLGTRFVFKLAIPQMSDPFELLGEVAWAQMDGAEPGMGIRFVYQDDRQRRAFEEIVEKLLLDSLGPVLFEKLLGKHPPERIA